MKYTAYEERFIADNYLTMTYGEIAIALGRTLSQIKSHCIRKGYRIPVEEKRRRAAVGTAKANYDPEFDRYVADNYLQLPLKKIALQFGYSYSKVYASLKRQGLSVPIEVAEAHRAESQFKPGIISHNKGKKQTEFMSPEGIAKTLATRFKKNRPPHNHQPVGTESVDKQGYTKVKVAEKVWQFKHIVIWEAANEPVKKGEVIAFKDGNRANVVLENLEKISRKQLGIRNHNIEKVAESSRQLSPAYVAGVLKRDTNLKNHEIPTELIILKTEQLKINRELKKLKKNGSKL